MKGLNLQLSLNNKCENLSSRAAFSVFYGYGKFKHAKHEMSCDYP